MGTLRSVITNRSHLNFYNIQTETGKQCHHWVSISLPAWIISHAQVYTSSIPAMKYKLQPIMSNNWKEHHCNPEKYLTFHQPVRMLTFREIHPKQPLFVMWMDHGRRETTGSPALSQTYTTDHSANISLHMTDRVSRKSQ